MWKILVACAFLLIQLGCSKGSASLSESPSSEFTVYENGLVYSEHTMSKLGEIVDSLNLRFKTCEPKVYFSFAQGYGTYFHINKNVEEAVRAIKTNASLKDFANKLKIEGRKEWIVQERYNYSGSKGLYYKSMNSDNMGFRYPDSAQYNKVSGWMYEERHDGLHAFFLHQLKPQAIPEKYASLIQYVDCMVDTSAMIHSALATSETELVQPAPDSKVGQFLNFVNGFPGEPAEPDVDPGHPHWEEKQKQYSRKMERWSEKRMDYINGKLAIDAKYRALMIGAVEEAIANPSRINEEVDFYSAAYLDPAKALELKRSYKVMGVCSADPRPRDQAIGICKLAAETHQWDIFLRSHLNIMNDKFERASDGSWAWGGRGTYMRELEELNINTSDLLIGTCLGASNLHDGHYSASTSRVGRSLIEAKDRDSVEDKLLSMVTDETLDLYNRVEMSYLFIFYTRSLNDSEHYVANLAKIKKAIGTLPESQEERFAILLED